MDVEMFAPVAFLLLQVANPGSEFQLSIRSGDWHIRFVVPPQQELKRGGAIAHTDFSVTRRGLPVSTVGHELGVTSGPLGNILWVRPTLGAGRISLMALGPDDGLMRVDERGRLVTFRPGYYTFPGSSTLGLSGKPARLEVAGVRLTKKPARRERASSGLVVFLGAGAALVLTTGGAGRPGVPAFRRFRPLAP